MFPTPGKSSETYQANCHCGAVQYNVTLSPPLFPTSDAPEERWPVISCNCSVCKKNGFLLVHPFAQNVHFTKGRENLSEYRWNTGRCAFLFCKTCGSSIGGDLTKAGDIDGGPRMNMNVRMFRNIDLKALQYREVDGKNMMPGKYEFDE
ncbi:hypothetical protein MBLNU457_g1037t1 [Dothideomycetes sp. NU457]